MEGFGGEFYYYLFFFFSFFIFLVGTHLNDLHFASVSVLTLVRGTRVLDSRFLNLCMFHSFTLFRDIVVLSNLV